MGRVHQSVQRDSEKMDDLKFPKSHYHWHRVRLVWLCDQDMKKCTNAWFGGCNEKKSVSLI